ncbi:MAG: hypothetical protein F4W90_12340 [Gammaproteobacteria bacterium]|nr:hypothetical protein [Gammaproteobacteria bacterium]
MTDSEPSQSTNLRSTNKGQARQYLKTIADLLPAIGFFGVFFIYERDMIVATVGLASGLAVQLLIYAVIKEAIPTWMKVLTAIAFVFAGLTLLFNDPNFIKIRASISGFLIACFFAGSVLINKNVLQAILGKFLIFPQKTWNVVTLLWSVPIFGNALLNLFMANLLPWPNWAIADDTWMTYRFISGFFVTAASFGFVFLYLFLTKQKFEFQRPENDD